MQTSRIGEPEERSATCSTRSRKVSSPRVDVVEEHDQRPLRRRVLERLAEGPCDLLRRNAHVNRSQKRADRGGRFRVRRQRVELLQHLDHGPVGDSLAVGKAAAADGRCFDGGEGLCDEARFAHACIADDRHELAPPFVQRPLPCLAHQAQAPARARRRASRGCARVRRESGGAAAPERARPCPSARAARSARLRRPRGQAPVWARRAARLPAPPPARAARRR